MTFARLHRAARRRTLQLKNDGDGGFVLVYVLAVTMLITMLVATVTFAAAANVGPAQRSAFGEAANAAAQGGIQAYYAKLTKTTGCSSLLKLESADPACVDLTPTATSGRTRLISADTSYAFSAGNQAYYTWTVLTVTAAFVRVQSTGEVGEPGAPFYSKKVVVADITGGSTRNFLDYAYYSTYETLSSAEIQKEFGARTVTFTKPAVLTDAGANPALASVHWTGVPTSGNTGSQWCSSLYYNPHGDSSANSATAGNGRYLQSSGLPVGYDWQETGSTVPASTVTHNGICQVDFTTGNKITGPAYSRDAFLLSNGTHGGPGPQFDAPVYSAWSTSDSPAANPPYNQFPYIGGGTKDGKNAPQSANFTLTLPTDVAGALTSNNATQVCEYWGPTRIDVKAGIAYVSSPMTAAGIGTCYSSNPGPGEVATNVAVTTTVVMANGSQRTNGAGTPSVLEAKVPVSSTLIYVHNANLSSTAPWTGQPIFQVNGATGVVGTPSSTTVTNAADNGVAYNGGLLASLLGIVQRPPAADGAWTLDWTYACSLLGLSCDASSANQVNFEKDLGKTYVDFKKQVIGTDGALKGATTGSLSTDLQSALASAFTADGKTLYPSSAGVPLPTGTSSVAYYVALSAESTLADTPVCQATNTTTPVSDPSVTAPMPANLDPLLGQKNGGTSATTTTCSRKQVTATVYRETGAQDQCIENKGLLGACSKYSYKWVSPTKQFDVTPTRTSKAATTNVVTPGTASFPLANDVTQYQRLQNGPGDAYIEGTLTGKLSIVSENDVIVSGNLTYMTPASDAASLVAKNNVRVYHPVACTDPTATATTTGYCPNDTTGLSPIDQLKFNASNFSSHPSRQYTNLRGDLQALTVSSAVYALTGSFIVDNYNRGEGYDPLGALAANGLKTLTLVGGVYQLHHGAAGVQWEIASSSTIRPTSGYSTTIAWDSTLQTRNLPYVPTPSGSNGSNPWQIVSTSTGGGS